MELLDVLLSLAKQEIEINNICYQTLVIIDKVIILLDQYCIQE